MSIGLQPRPCTNPPTLASPPARALTVIAAMVATLAMGSDHGPNLWRVVGTMLPEPDAALLGLALAILVGSAAALAAHATMRRSTLPALALTGALLATLAAPANATVSLPIIATLIAAYCLTTHTVATTLTAALAIAGILTGGVASCALIAAALHRLLRTGELRAANDNRACESDPMWRPIDQALKARLLARR